MISGLIMRSVAGFYYVKCNDTLFEVSAKGVFRHLKIKPMVGDRVDIDEGMIVNILPRRNSLIRPKVANVDKLIIVLAGVPEPDFLLLDKQLVFCKKENISPIIAINKVDLDEVIAEYVKKAYGKHYMVLSMAAKTGQGIANFYNEVVGSIVCFTGQSAVGKSSLINALFSLSLETGEISKKINRGKNTTREARIFDIGDTYIVDTPGFSSFDLSLPENELKEFYPEFKDMSCDFSDCMHIGEKGCNMFRDKDIIDTKRYQRYIKIFNELKSIKKY